MNPFDKFNPRAGRYDADNARLMALVSELAYEDNPELLTFRARSWGFEPSFFDKGETQVIALESKDALIIGPRGTEIKREGPLKKRGLIRRFIRFFLRLYVLWLFRIDIDQVDLSDVLTDLDFRKRPGPLAGKVHKGFLDAFNLVWDSDLLPYIESVRKRRGDIPIFFTGHSLGAALATLMAAASLENGITPAGVYLFGSPRVGDWRFCKALDQLLRDRIWRIVNNNDFVTRIPPSILFLYLHVGHLVYLATNGQVLFNPDYGVLRRDRIKGRIQDFGRIGPDGAGDHLLARYKKALR